MAGENLLMFQEGQSFNGFFSITVIKHPQHKPSEMKRYMLAYES